MKRGMWVGKILIMVMIGIALMIGFGIGTMYLWNWLIPVLFNGPVITFWQTVGLLVLSKILFSGFGRGGHCSGGHRGPWRPYWKEKWSAMSPDDRERFKEKMKNKWCYPRSENPEANSGSPTV